MFSPQGRTWSKRRIELFIFLAFLAVRLAFTIATRHAGLELDRDTARYDEQSTGILHGNYDLETPLFITAPLYSYTQAAFKYVFGAHWAVMLQALQILLCCWSGVVLYRIGLLLFDQRVALVAAAGYCVFPLTLLWVYSLAQDMPFQLLLIFFVHALLRAVRERTWGRTAWAAVLFALTFLMKSHLLLFTPFLALFIWLNMALPPVRRAMHLVLFTAVCGVLTLPYGLYNLHRHGIYVISSTGQGGHFLTGHNDDVYTFIVDPPPLGSPEHTRILKMDYLVLRQLDDTLKTLPHRAKQQIYLETGLAWCRANPGKLVKLTLYDLCYFLLPGLNPHHYGFLNWLVMFLISLPLYAFAYPGVVIALRASFCKHLWMLGLFFTMVLFSCVFYVQNRFRTITLEPFYILYASFALLRFARWLGLAKRFPLLAAPVGA